MIYSENILICIIVPLVVLMVFLPGKTRRLVGGLIIGMVVSLMGAYLNGYFSAIYNMDATLTARYISPMIEEIMKFLPIMLYLLLFDPDNSELIGFSASIGAGFATFENCCYITQNGAQLIQLTLIRGLSVGIMHVECGLVIGICFLLVKRYKSIMIPGMIGAFSFAMSIHSLYNLLVSVDGIAAYLGFGAPLIILALLYFSWQKSQNEAIEQEE